MRATLPVALLTSFALAGCCPPPRPPEAAQISVLNGANEPRQSAEIGSTLYFGVSGLTPGQSYEVFLTAEEAKGRPKPRDPNTLAVVRLPANHEGRISQTAIWYRTGIVGCLYDARSATPFQYPDFDAALESLHGRTLSLAVFPTGGDEPVGTAEVPVAYRTTPRLVAKTDKGCEAFTFEPDDTIVISGQGLPPGKRFHVSVVPFQHAWSTGNEVRAVTEHGLFEVTTGEGGAFERRVEFPGLAGSFSIVAERVHGAYDAWDDYVSTLGEPAFTLDPRWRELFRVRSADIAGRLVTDALYAPTSHLKFQFANGFNVENDTVYAAMYPSAATANLAGETARIWITQHREAGSGGWDTVYNASTPIDPGTSPVGPAPAAIVPVSPAGYVFPVAIWSPPLELGDWDVVVDFGADGAFDAGTDRLDGGDRIGFVVAPDPYGGPSPYEAACASYRDGGLFTVVYAGEEIDVEISGVVCYPAGRPSILFETPVAPGNHPLFVIQHGNHPTCIDCPSLPDDADIPDDWDPNSCKYDYCDHPLPSHQGYMELLRNLARNGIIAVSIDGHDLNETGGMGGAIAFIEERAMLFIKHLELWSHLNDPTVHPEYGAYPGLSFGSRFHGHVDMSRISISGHSNGGEATLEAYAMNTEFDIGSVSAIAPTDSRSGAVSLSNAPYFVIIPAADGDAWPSLGARIYDRVAEQNTKSGAYVYGANHQWFNTVWATDPEAVDDSDPNRHLKLSKADQQRIGEAFIAAFARVHLNGEAVYEEMLRGDLVFPSIAGYAVYPFYHHSYHRKLESGDGSEVLVPPDGSVTVGPASDAGEYHEFDFNDVLKVHWNNPYGSDGYIRYEGPWNASIFEVLSFRAAWTDWFDWTADPPPSIDAQQLWVELASGSEWSLVGVGYFGGLPAPYPHPDRPADDPYNIMTTIRIPLAAFVASNPAIDLKLVDSIELRFHYPQEGELFIDDLEFSR